MILTDKSVFLHIPKTGGMWVRHVLEPIAIGPFNPQESIHPITVPAEHANKDRFTFVRNPWAWYVSLYNYDRYGSNEPYLCQGPSALFKYTKTEITFKDYVVGLLDPNSWIKKKIINAVTLEKLKFKTQNKLFNDELLEAFKNSNESFFNCLITNFTTGTRLIGKMESLQADLLTMLEMNNQVSDSVMDKITHLAYVNKGKEVQYQEYYSSDLRALVEKDSAEMIEKFKYIF